MSDFTPKTLGELCQHTKLACDALRPLIQEVYAILSEETTKTKKDFTAFSIADGLVQHFLVHYLFEGKVKDAVGEESVRVNISSKPYMVDDLIVPTSLESIIDVAGQQLTDIASAVCDHSYKNLTVSIDPIDGTKGGSKAPFALVSQT